MKKLTLVLLMVLLACSAFAERQLNDEGRENIKWLAENGFICQEYGHQWLYSLDTVIEFNKEVKWPKETMSLDIHDYRHCTICNLEEIKATGWQEVITGGGDG